MVLSIPSSTPISNTRGQRTTIFIQDECLQHRFIRSRDISGIVERPERLHAVKLGLAAAISHIESAESAINVCKSENTPAAVTDEGDLAAALARMAITPASNPTPSSAVRTTSVTIRNTSASISLLDHAAVKYVHGDIDGDVYLEKLISWARDSRTNIMEKGTEIPEDIPPLDLYLCPGSIHAIQGAIGAVCEAVDASIMATHGPQSRSNGPDDPCARAFVAVRPPGHHCGEDTPSGFCFINNVMVGAAHAHLNHGVQRIVILDIDLHHGNGSQSLIWQINEETYQQTLVDSESPQTVTLAGKPGPRMFYGSLHDILSFPCEDGRREMVQAASTSIHGAHGQYIENIHLQKYNSEAQFWAVLYPRYLTLLQRARDFLDDTGGPGDDVIILISCGFDAGEYEHSFMSRHDRKVPVGFYHQFTREMCKLADQYACGRVVSVLEGGYSDRALISGAMAHLCGLVDLPGQDGLSDERWVDDTWWSEANLVKLERAAKPRKSASARWGMDEWLARTLTLLPVLNGGGADVSSSGKSSMSGASADARAPPTSKGLRERKKPALDVGGSTLPDAAHARKPVSRNASQTVKPSVQRRTSAVTSTNATNVSTSRSMPEVGRGENNVDERERTEKKKLPRVILHVRPPDPAG